MQNSNSMATLKSVTIEAEKALRNQGDDRD